jgi:hypothetical protein
MKTKLEEQFPYYVSDNMFIDYKDGFKWVVMQGDYEKNYPKVVQDSFVIKTEHLFPAVVLFDVKNNPVILVEYDNETKVVKECVGLIQQGGGFFQPTYGKPNKIYYPMIFNLFEKLEICTVERGDNTLDVSDIDDDIWIEMKDVVECFYSLSPY